MDGKERRIDIVWRALGWKTGKRERDDDGMPKERRGGGRERKRGMERGELCRDGGRKEEEGEKRDRKEKEEALKMIW